MDPYCKVFPISNKQLRFQQLHVLKMGLKFKITSLIRDSIDPFPKAQA